MGDEEKNPNGNSNEDSKDYTFVSYSNKDEEIVLPNLTMLNELEDNVFYKKITENPAYSFPAIQKKVINSKLLIPFLTPNVIYTSSSGKEILIAAMYKIPIIPIYLKETQLDETLYGAIGNMSSIMQYEMSDEEYVETCTNELKRINEKIKKERKGSKSSYLKRLFGFQPSGAQDIHHIDGKDSISARSWNLTKTIFEKIFDGEAEQAAMVKPPKTSGARKNEYFLSSEPHELDRKSMYGLLPKEPIYISFSHENIDLVFEDIMLFKSHGIDFKYDEAVDFCNEEEPDSKWISNVNFLIKKCSLFIFYLSAKSLLSKRRVYELIFAVEEGMQIYLVYLEEPDYIDPLLQKIILDSKVHVFK